MVAELRKHRVSASRPKSLSGSPVSIENRPDRFEADASGCEGITSISDSTRSFRHFLDDYDGLLDGAVAAAR